MRKIYTLIFKLRLEEFLALLLFIPMVIFMVLFHDKEGFYKSDIDRFVGTLITFIVFLGIIKTKDLKIFQKHIVGIYFVKFLQFLREILPFGLCILIYTNMHNMVHLINPNDIDPLLIKIDEFLLGVQPGIWLEQFISKPMTDYMYFSYSMFFIYPMLLPAILYFKGDYKNFRTVLAGTILTFYVGYIGYVIFPAVGPKFTLSHLFSVHLDGGIITDKISHIINYEISEYTRRDCFPSLHNGVTMLTLLFSFKYLRWFFYIVLPFAISLFIATLYLRYHYFIDMLAGYVLALSMFLFAPKLESAWNKLMNQFKNGITY
ncbi:MAG: phosphatase PAP2 family protein [Salinivirgaceae bacterium]|nr:phosphatase PAP2 family protein [Salinivirgaceae bacterium]